MSLTKSWFCMLAVLGLAGISTWLVEPTQAQGKGSGDWVSHNFDRHNTRFSPLDQISGTGTW